MSTPRFVASSCCSEIHVYRWNERVAWKHLLNKRVGIVYNYCIHAFISLEDSLTSISSFSSNHQPSRCVMYRCVRLRSPKPLPRSFNGGTLVKRSGFAVEPRNNHRIPVGQKWSQCQHHIPFSIEEFCVPNATPQVLRVWVWNKKICRKW